MFHKIEINQRFIDYNQVHVNYTGRWSQKLNPTVSLVCFSINGCQIIMASKHFKQTEDRVKKTNLYEKLNISLNCDLSTIEHGTDNDIPDINMPIFLSWADKMHTYLELNKEKPVLVNCNNGRSRTGTVVALYLMKYHNLSSKRAISIVTSVLTFRGIVKNSINIETKNLHGNYGDWLHRWELENKSQVSQTQDNSQDEPDKKRKFDAYSEPLITEPMENDSLIIKKKQKVKHPVKTENQGTHADNYHCFFNINHHNLTETPLPPAEDLSGHCH